MSYETAKARLKAATPEGAAPVRFTENGKHWWFAHSDKCASPEDCSCDIKRRELRIKEFVAFAPQDLEAALKVVKIFRDLNDELEQKRQIQGPDLVVYIEKMRDAFREFEELP